MRGHSCEHMQTHVLQETDRLQVANSFRHDKCLSHIYISHVTANLPYMLHLVSGRVFQPACQA